MNGSASQSTAKCELKTKLRRIYCCQANTDCDAKNEIRYFWRLYNNIIGVYYVLNALSDGHYNITCRETMVFPKHVITLFFFFLFFLLNM